MLSAFYETGKLHGVVVGIERGPQRIRFSRVFYIVNFNELILLIWSRVFDPSNLKRSTERVIAIASYIGVDFVVVRIMGEPRCRLLDNHPAAEVLRNCSEGIARYMPGNVMGIGAFFRPAAIPLVLRTLGGVFIWPRLLPGRKRQVLDVVEPNIDGPRIAEILDALCLFDQIHAMAGFSCIGPHCVDVAGEVREGIPYVGALGAFRTVLDCPEHNRAQGGIGEDAFQLGLARNSETTGFGGSLRCRACGGGEAYARVGACVDAFTGCARRCSRIRLSSGRCGTLALAGRCLIGG